MLVTEEVPSGLAGPEEEKRYTVDQLAVRYHLHKDTVRRYIRQEGLQARFLGGFYTVSDQDWQAFLATRGKRRRPVKRKPQNKMK